MPTTASDQPRMNFGDRPVHQKTNSCIRADPTNQLAKAATIEMIPMFRNSIGKRDSEAANSRVNPKTMRMTKAR